MYVLGCGSKDSSVEEVIIKLPSSKQMLKLGSHINRLAATNFKLVSKFIYIYIYTPFVDFII